MSTNILGGVHSALEAQGSPVEDVPSDSHPLEGKGHDNKVRDLVFCFNLFGKINWGLCLFIFTFVSPFVSRYTLLADTWTTLAVHYGEIIPVTLHR